jgi:hypothetical protein
MYREQLLRLVVDNKTDYGVCRYCKQPFIWRITPTGRSLPIEVHALPVRVDQHAETYVRYELFDREALHMAHCKKQPNRRPEPFRASDRLTQAEARN